jgi:hypothetical protein
LEKLSVDYMTTGITEHGSNVTVVVYNETGAIIGYNSTVADAAGNWVLTFPDVVLDKSPHHIEVQVTRASYNDSTAGEFNTRVYYTPAVDARALHYKGLNVGDVMAERAEEIGRSMHAGFSTPFGSVDDDWNHPHEFLGSSNVENL